MKKIYFIFAIAFSIALFLLSPGLKVEAGHNSFPEFSMVFANGTKSEVTFTTTSSDFYAFSVETCDGSKGVMILSKESATATYSFKFNENQVVGLTKSVDRYSSPDYYCALIVDFWPESSGSHYSDASCNFLLNDSYGVSVIGSQHSDTPFYLFANEVAQKLSNGEDPFFVPPTYTPDFSGLGYLKGLGKYYKEQTVYSQSTNLFGIKRYIISDRKYIFGWDAESTSGVQLSDENISVNVKVQLFGNRSTLSGETVPIKCNGTIVDFGNVPASAFYYSTSLAEFLVKFDFSDTNDLNGDKKPIFYFRLERKNDDNTVTYGNTLKFDPSAPIEYISDSLSSSPEGTISVGDLTDSGFVVDGSIESETVTGQGISGSSWEEITINSNMNFVQDNSMITNMESFLSQIGSIPRIVGVLFSFLPSWCLGFVGLGLGMLVTVLVIKVVRG